MKIDTKGMLLKADRLIGSVNGALMPLFLSTAEHAHCFGNEIKNLCNAYDAQSAQLAEALEVIRFYARLNGVEFKSMEDFLLVKKPMVKLQDIGTQAQAYLDKYGEEK